MIVFEDGIESIVEQIPSIDGFKPNFHWGDKDELNRYVTLKKQPYPLIWLLIDREEHDLKNQEITRKTKFIIATRENKVDRLNDVRLNESFEKVLIPLVNYLIEGVTKSTKTDFPDRKLGIVKHPNYSGYDTGTRTDQKNYTVDIWDAISIDCNIRMNNNCQNTIKWQKRQ